MRVWLVLIIVVVGLGVAIVKPWDPGLSGRPARADPSSSPAEETSLALPTIAATGSIDPLAIPCLTDAASWRVVTVERTSGRETRSWIAIQPTTAAGPSDPNIPQVRVVADALGGLGFCAPDTPRFATDPRVWRVPIAGGSEFGTLEPLKRLVPAATGHANVYAPPASGTAWLPGRYVIEVPLASDPRRRGVRGSAWFAVLVVDAPGRGRSPRTAEPAPSASATGL